MVWGGPAFVYDQSRQYPWGTSNPVKNETSNNLGFVIGKFQFPKQARFPHFAPM